MSEIGEFKRNNFMVNHSFVIKDEFDKDEVMDVFGAVYDIWKAKETENVKNGCGRSGLDGMMTVDVWRLFNQLLTVLSIPKYLESLTTTD